MIITILSGWVESPNRANHHLGRLYLELNTFEIFARSYKEERDEWIWPVLVVDWVTSCLCLDYICPCHAQEISSKIKFYQVGIMYAYMLNIALIKKIANLWGGDLWPQTWR